MDVIFACDDRYVEHVPVAVESLLESAANDADISIWLVTTATATSAMHDSLRRQVADRAALRLLIADVRFQSLPTSSRPSLAYLGPGSCLRLFLPELLPETVNRYLYLDTDVFVERDLQPLAELPVQGVPIAAVRDRFTPTVGAQGGLPGAPPTLGCDAPYFNSGVMMVDRVEWRRRAITARCVEYLERNRRSLRIGDQDSLNVACDGAWMELPEKWNYQGWWPDSGQVESPPADLRITHYLGRRKPWEPDFPLEAHRRRYAAMADAAMAAADRPLGPR